MNSHQETLNDLARILDNYAQEIEARMETENRLCERIQSMFRTLDNKEARINELEEEVSEYKRAFEGIRATNSQFYLQAQEARDLKQRLDVVREQREEMQTEMEEQKREYEDSLQELWVRVESLRATNAALRAENATLRRMRDEACEASLDAGPVVDEGDRVD